MKIRQRFGSVYDERPYPQKIKALIIHCATHSAEDMIDLLNERKLSAHYVIGGDGIIWQLVAEGKRAWHAGISSWREMENLNHYSIGIELSSPTMGQNGYPEQQIKSLIKLCRQIMRHYQIKKVNVAAHSDIAPTRKPDPGKAFPWHYLASKGIGLWYDLADAVKVAENDVAKLLQIIGYDTHDLPAASYAFCRHFVPQEVAIWDDISELCEKIYPQDFVLPEKYLPILKACAYKYAQNRQILSADF